MPNSLTMTGPDFADHVEEEHTSRLRATAALLSCRKSVSFH
jgi:hypothetical protein